MRKLHPWLHYALGLHCDPFHHLRQPWQQKVLRNGGDDLRGERAGSSMGGLTWTQASLLMCFLSCSSKSRQADSTVLPLPL